MPKRVISTHNVPTTDPFAGTVAVLGLDDNVIMTKDVEATIPTWSPPWQPTTAEYLTATLEDGTKRVVDLAIEAGAKRHIGALDWHLHPDGRIAVYAARQRKLAVEMWVPDAPPADLEAIARALYRVRAGTTVQLNGTDVLVLRSVWSDGQMTLDVKLQAVAGPEQGPVVEGS